MDLMVVPLSLLVGLLAVFLILLHLYRKIGYGKLDEIKERLEEAEKRVANLDIRSREQASEIEEVRKKNEDYVKFLKTVVHGFDYIVQGCKTALGIEAVSESSEKIVSSDQQRQIVEAEGED